MANKPTQALKVTIDRANWGHAHPYWPDGTPCCVSEHIRDQLGEAVFGQICELYPWWHSALGQINEGEPRVVQPQLVHLAAAVGVELEWVGGYVDRSV